MASVVTTFYSRGGTQYRLTLTGASIPSGKTITLSGESPIKISYPQASCKFAGLRTVSATIHIIADENMDWLYAAGPTSTSVLVESVEENVGTTIFKGYLVPFVYDMPFQLVRQSKHDMLRACLREAEEAANDPNEPRCTDPTKLREFLLS